MNCKDFDSLLEEYHNGEIDSELAASIQLHLGNCPECAEALGQLQAEEKLYQRYLREVESGLRITPAMWSRVQAAINPPGAAAARSGRFSKEGLWRRLFPSADRPAWGRQLAFATLLVVLSVAGTLVVVRYQGTKGESARSQPPAAKEFPASVESREHATEQQRVADDASGGKSLEAAMRAIQRAERDYLDAIQVLTDIVDKRKPTLDAGLVRELNRNLRTIDENIAATRKAYYAHPSDPYLAQYMLTAYSKKVELLQELAT